MIVARAVGLMPVDLFAPERQPTTAERPSPADDPDDLFVDNTELAIALHRAALVVPLLRVPPSRIQAGSALQPVA